jgi:hypothetical protein
MKTILVVYSNIRLSKSEHQTLKRYAFNIDEPVKVGDRLKLEKYSTPVQVVEILPKPLKYVNLHSGAMSNKRTASTQQVEIRTLHIEVAETMTAVRLED